MLPAVSFASCRYWRNSWGILGNRGVRALWFLKYSRISECHSSSLSTFLITGKLFARKLSTLRYSRSR